MCNVSFPETAVDISDLRVFEAVARVQNMKRAAEELNTVQSNVTARIRQLEADLGIRLFDRHSRGVKPTAAGQRLLPFAHKAISLVKEARLAVSDDVNPVGPLVVGALETVLAMRLSPIFGRLAKDYPAVDVTIKTGTTRELIEMVLNYDLEGAFICGPAHHKELETTFCSKEELVLLSALEYPNLDDLLTGEKVKQIVLRHGCSYRQRLEDVFARRGVIATGFLEFGTLEAILAAVSAGVGVTLMPRRLIGTAWPADQVRVHGLPREESEVTTVFIRRRDMYFSNAAATLLKLAQEHGFDRKNVA